MTDSTGRSDRPRPSYGVYGELLSRTGTTNTPFLFNGKWGVQTDSNGIYYHRARYYHPGLRRFLNQDTVLGSIGINAGLNRFAYANGQPVTGVDPLGLSADDSMTAMATAGLVGGAFGPMHAYGAAVSANTGKGACPPDAPNSEGGGNSLKLIGSVGLSGTLGAMWGIAPGFFISGSVSLQGGIDLTHPLNSYVGVNYTYSPMIGMGFVAAASTTYSGGLDWGETVTTGQAPTATTAHLESGFQDGPTPYITNAAIDLNTDGVGYAKPGEGVGLDIHVAGGVTRTNAVNVTVGDMVNYVNIMYLNGKYPLVNTSSLGHKP